MNEKPSNTREALMAELLGDIQHAIDRLEAADKSARDTAAAVSAATAQYQTKADELVNRLRAETENIVLKTTAHAAQALVGQQQATLQAAATAAMKQTLNEQFMKRSQRDWLIAFACGGLVGAVAALATFAALRLLLK
jgi:hypothetical protein